MKATITALLALLVGTSLASIDRDFNYFWRRQFDRSIGSIKSAYEPLPIEERSADYRYYNSKTKPYFIEKWPLVNFDTGEFYSGQLPIGDEEDRKLFFIFKPAINKTSNDLTVWLNGGPGCSSLVGFFQENGPILWQAGTYEPIENPYTWALETNMIWVEQPVGTGFATGKIEARNEVDIAKDFVKFFKNFEELFGIKNYRIFMTGESYAGRYVPYIAAQMLDQKDKEYFDLSGALVYDPCIGDFIRVGQEIVAYPFVMANQEILGLDQSTLTKMENLHNKCGYQDFIDKYMQFPPPSVQPEYPVYTYEKCDVFNIYADAIVEKNPCFNIYHITDYCPLLGDVVGNPGGLSCLPQTYYFNRTDVKKALHAPLDVSWSQCGEHEVFKGKFVHGIGAGPEGENDRSLDPIQHVLPQVIEATNRVIVSNANWDGLLLTNGTLLQIQNMTWNGKLGFQKEPSTPFISSIKDKEYGSGSDGRSGKQGPLGIYHEERGLMWIATDQAGHMQPQYQPRATLQHIQWLLGYIDDFSSDSDKIDEGGN